MFLQILVLVLVFTAGYASQRGRTCAVSAAFEIAKRRRARRFAGYLFAAACSLAVLSFVSLFDPDVFAGFKAQGLSGWTLLGGIVFAIGAWINGRCSLGTIARLGSGDLVRLGTLGGIFGGTTLGIFFASRETVAGQAAIFSQVAPTSRIGVAILAMAALAILVRRIVPRDFNPSQWSIPKSMLVIGLANGLLVWLARDWSYTSLFRHMARGDAVTGFGLLCFATLVAGAMTAGVVSQQLVWRLGLPREWLLAVVGGLLMGIGVVLVPGGNDTMLLVGLPLLLPQLIAGYAVVYATLVAIAWITPDRPAAK
jgi:uncharacterized protein